MRFLILLLLAIPQAWPAVSVVLTTPYVAPKPVIMCQRNSCYSNGPQTGSNVKGMYAAWHAAGACSWTSLQFLYGNYNAAVSGGDAVGDNAITITPSVDFFYNGYSTRTVLQFSGSSPIVINPGATALSDTILAGTWVPANAEFHDVCFLNGGATGT